MASRPRQSLPDLQEDMSIPLFSPSPSLSHSDTASASSQLPSDETPQTPHYYQQHPTGTIGTATTTATTTTTTKSPHSRSPTTESLQHWPLSPDAVTPTSPSVGTGSASPSRGSLHSIKRKPLSSAASPFAIRFSQASASTVPFHIDLPRPDHRFSRADIDSPTFYEYPKSDAFNTRPLQPSAAILTSSNRLSAESRYIQTAQDPSGSQDEFSDVLSGYDDLISDLTPDAGPLQSPTTFIDVTADDAHSTYSDYLDQRDSSPPPMFAPKPTPPHLQLEKVDTTSIGHGTPTTGAELQSPQSAKSQLNKPLPRSPSGGTSPFAAFFGWGNQSPSATEFSSVPSPLSPSRTGGANDASANLNSLSDARTNASNNALGYCESYLSTPPPSSYSSYQVEEMEEELRAISFELASSIRREIDLEDLVDRLQEQANGSHVPSKRTSDYFSDSGYSSTKASEAEQNRDELERIQRRSDQEKASIRLELTNKLQDERSKRKALDQQIKDLAERASQVDLASMNNTDANERVRDLENTCEDLRRRLSEERSSKHNFEDLLSALKGELQDACNERDNLRDEVLPQLRARVEGLEAEASEYTNLTYESSKMQQELENLKLENSNLRRGSVMGMMDQPRANSRMSGGLSRSNSVAAGLRNQRPPIGLSRSNSVKTGQAESREALSERLKDVELQRDALHGALKNLLERQELQTRDYEKRIRFLEAERERLLTGPTKKGGFEREIQNLRTEINVLRRRAEDALEQKWQVEQGLTGLKMDLDRAEGEITSLRELLNEKDILIPETFARLSGSTDGNNVPVTSESLKGAYQKLQAAYTESLQRIKKLETGVESDERTQLAIKQLEEALSVAVFERDVAKQEMEIAKSRYDRATANEAKSVYAESALADELSESARQVTELALQVHQQLSANAELRTRLADAVALGDADRKANNSRITGLMERLGTLEDQLISAQTASEDRVAQHEEEASRLREAHNGQLRRADGNPSLGGMRSPALKSLRSMASLGRPTASSLFPGVVPTKTLEDAAEMTSLRTKVAELEKALADTEKEMQEVITRMSTAQVEVMNLQEERDTAVRQTRRLQKTLEEEQMKSFEERFKTLRT